MKTIVSDDIALAASFLMQDELVAIPTETVYGLAGNIFSENAIRAIFDLKNRPLYNPLIVHIADRDQLDSFVSDIPEVALKLADAFWPGPMTLVLKKKDFVPDLVTAGKDTVAVRIPAHNLTQKLLRTIDFPIAAPSANPFGRISPTKAEHVRDYFEGQLSMVLDGGTCTNGLESTIIGFEGEKAVIYRLGSLSKEDIERIAGPCEIKNKAENNPHAPGMLSKHYAPRTPFYLTEDIGLYLEQHVSKKIAVLLFKDKTLPIVPYYKCILSQQGLLSEAASQLYKSLHELDELQVDVIVAELLPEYGLGRSINDRLRRASI